MVIGSGIAAQRLSADVGLRLLENAAATGAGLFALILMFGPVSGGHFNPVVSLVDAAFGGLSRRTALAYPPAPAPPASPTPRITVGRAFSDTFARIAPASGPAFIAAQLAGGVVG